MRETRHLTRSSDGTTLGRRAHLAASHLVLVLLASASCQADDMVRPRPDTVFSRMGPAPEALARAQHVQVKSLSDGHSIRGSNAVLKRQSAGLTVKVRTHELDPNESVDVFWAVFNNPAECTHPNPLTGAPCSPADLFVEDVRASLHYVATLTADARGGLRYSASLASRSTVGCIGDPFPCHTVTSPFDAEVHSALFVPNGGAGRQAGQFLPR